MIRLSSLNKYFNKNRQNEIHVINNVNLELPDKGMVAIFGKSGCGKTTLLNVIGGLDSVQSGSVEIDGQNVKNRADYLRNKYIGYIFQNYNLSKGETNYENVADALRLCGITDAETIGTRVNAALKNVGMEKFAKRTPDTLSGGQMQRIAIARAIVKNPKIILADEPTGNLDEANTLLIMNLLKQISKDRLVLLVTHEANLVDYYCDKVIELFDGKVVSERDNEGAEGLNARSKNDIFLGELDKTEISAGSVAVDYYGGAPEKPLSLKIINHGGKLYLKVDDPTVQILDQTSEVKLREGVFEEKVKATENAAEIDMSALPPIDTDGKKYGKLFGFKGSVVSGYRANFKKGKKGKGVLRACMFLFSLVIVFMTASLGTSIRSIQDVKKTYDKNVFYVYIGNDSDADKISSAIGQHGIDGASLYLGMPSGSDEFLFNPGNFETFESDYFFSSSNLPAYATTLSAELTKEMPLVAGKKEVLDGRDIVITTSVADQIIEKSTFGYINDYSDLVGLSESRGQIIAGVVRSDENAVFVSKESAAKNAFNNFVYVTRKGDMPIEVENGKAMLIVKYDYGEITFPKAGDTLKLCGKDVTVGNVLRLHNKNDGIEQFFRYEDFCAEMGYELTSEEQYIAKRLSDDGYTTLNPEYNEKKDEYGDLYYFDALAEYYSFLDEYVNFTYYFGDSYNTNSVFTWIYVKKGISDAKYFANGLSQLYYAEKYKEKNGEYPTFSEYKSSDNKNELLFSEKSDEILNTYQNEYWSESKNYYGYEYSVTDENYFYVLSDEDYYSCSSSVGVTSKEFIDPYSLNVESYDGYYYYGYMPYAQIHSTNAEQTKDYLLSEFASVTVSYENLKPIYTPESFFDEAIYVNKADIISNMIEMAVFIGIMSVCMYFIMRSSLMSRIKEVGIYRAIGVSKANLMYKFGIESLVLTTLTVFIGFAASSALVFFWTSGTTMIAEVFFYPVWLAALVLLVLYVICTVCGCLPIFNLLRKTPSEILAKYDI